MAIGLHLTAYLGVFVNLGPDREHQTDIHLVKTVGQSLGVGIMVFVKAHSVPAVLAPILPVLHNHTHRHLFTAEAVGCLQYFLGRVEALAAMDISQCPRGHLRAIAGDVAICGNDLVGRTQEDSIINHLSHRRLQYGLVLHEIIEESRAVVVCQFGRDAVTPFLQMNDSRGSRREPQVLHFYHRLTINGEVMTSSHSLSYIEQQTVVARLRNIQFAVEDIALTHLFLAAFGGCDINDFALPCPAVFCQLETLATRIEVGEAVVVPQDSVAFA